MKAYLITNPGDSDALELKEVPDPKAKKGQARIAIKAFGLNRAEAVTRMGGSGKAVKFPRIMGIECLGKALDCPGGELKVGQKVSASTGGIGTLFHRSGL